MIRTLASALFLLLVSNATLAIDTPSRIDAVTLYPSGATVTRIATVDLPAGITTVRLTGLVNDLDAGRMRIDAGPADLQLGQVRLVRQQQRQAFNDQVERLNDEIRAAQARISGIDDAVKSAELRLKFLDGIAQGYAKEAWRDSAQGAADIDSWRAALTLLDTASAQAYTEIRERKREKNDAQRDLSLLQRELAELRGGALASSVVEVAIQAPRATRADLRLHYFQGDARWQPEYEARLDSDRRQLQLVQQALVTQGTAEAWSDVSLSLSTSDPSGQLEPDTPASEFLDLQDPVALSPKRREARFSAANALEEVMVTGSEIVDARVGNVAVTYDIPGRVSVASRANESQSFDINTTSAEIELLTRVVPRDSERAYLAARFVYAGNVPLYSSNMQVFVDNAYAGVTQMPTALPQAELTLPMGVDRRVEVNSVDRGEQRGDTGIVSRKKTETTSYLFEITNRRQSPTTVEVLDRYPVARNDDIDVDIPRNATEPAATAVDEQPGVVLWRKTLSPNETWRIDHRYTVTYPADKVLQRR